MTAWRERKRLADAERGATTTEADTEQPVTMARQTGAEILRQMRDLAAKLAESPDRLTEAAATLGDTGAAEAEIESARKAAEQRAATAEAKRAAADGPTAKCGPRQMRPPRRCSAHLATGRPGPAKPTTGSTEATAAHTAELERIREETQARITLAEEDRDSAIEAAEAAKDAAIRAADTRAAQAETRARKRSSRRRPRRGPWCRRPTTHATGQ